MHERQAILSTTVVISHTFCMENENEPEEVRHGDVTAGVKRGWNVITAEKYSFFQS